MWGGSKKGGVDFNKHRKERVSEGVEKTFKKYERKGERRPGPGKKNVRNHHEIAGRGKREKLGWRRIILVV